MEALIPRKDESHGSTRKYTEELRERASGWRWRSAADPAPGPVRSRGSGSNSVFNPETLRNWVRQAEIDDGTRPGTTTDDAKRLAELERENRELRRANEILRTASAFFAAAELDRKLK